MTDHKQNAKAPSRMAARDWQMPDGLTPLEIHKKTLMRGPRSSDEGGDLPRVYFTSDLHLNHANVILEGYCPERGRLFGSVDGMNDALIARWNARVREGDLVIVVGDFTMGFPDSMPALVRRLSGTIWLVEGNHDRRPKSRQTLLRALVARYIRGFAVLEVPGIGKLLIGHHPVPAGMEGRGLPHGATLQLCGHVHQHWARRGNVINVGVDVRDFEPKTLSEILAAEGVAMPEGAASER